MLTLSGIATAMGILVLALILGYTIVNGISYFNLDFIMQAAKPVGEAGGGMRDEIFGTLILVVLASVIALPIGLMTGVFVSEYAGQKLASAVRFAADILAGVPSIVVGRFCLCHTSAADAHVLRTFSGRCAGYYHDSRGGQNG